jgi:uncharacterized protein (DUF4415 family)
MSKLTKKQSEELRRLADQPEEEIDTSDIPERNNWRIAEQGRFYRPVKQQITLRLDADVLAWFKSRKGRYQTRINAVLREYVANHHDEG